MSSEKISVVLQEKEEKKSYIRETNEHHCEILDIPAILVQMYHHLPQCIFPNET
jgi:hypothetical protein